jgi:hypothetical protein
MLRSIITQINQTIQIIQQTEVFTIERINGSRIYLIVVAESNCLRTKIIGSLSKLTLPPLPPSSPTSESEPVSL